MSKQYNKPRSQQDDIINELLEDHGIEIDDNESEFLFLGKLYRATATRLRSINRKKFDQLFGNKRATD